MEALEVMQKTNKSFYKWHGLDRLPELMFALQRDAQKGELPIKIAKVEKAMCSFTTNFNLNFTEEKIKMREEKHSIEELPEDEEEDSAFGPLTSRDRCGKNSLAQLCRSTMLIKDLDSEGYEPPSRSRCRRLYDIANVLAMMSLVEKKHHLFGTKKIPLFVYCGPEPDEKIGEIKKEGTNWVRTQAVKLSNRES
uniref:E2F/DP family winged-helix DNA-binding domain-containing protein n=1 Tax=Meloidogyne javanica TaxID=6303 RepID=A0A915M1I3_MELJA